MRFEEPVRRPGLAPIGGEASTLTELVFDAIRNAVADGTLAPGQRLSESRIAAQLGVSKTPVRESLLHLKHIGLVENTDRGLSVVRVSAVRIREAYELRAVLEGRAAKYAAQRAEDAVLDELVAISKQSVALSETEQFEEREVWDQRFHKFLAQASGNRELNRAIGNVFLLTWTLRLRDLPHSRKIACANDHYDVALALQQRDHLRAADLMEHHILAIMDLILAAKLEDSPEADATAQSRLVRRDGGDLLEEWRSVPQSTDQPAPQSGRR
jgi:GntR family transcriptional regulator, rspAB operon transcriptional repressor